jgi:tryptophan synthase alpha chain
MSDQPRGLAALSAMFAAAKAAKRCAFLPYLPVGYPDYDQSLDAIAALAEQGADGFEIGIPFSDPLADGPTVQAATQTALANGITVKRCVEAVRDLRGRGVSQPMLLMGYLNPLLAYGLAAFVKDAKAAGADGFIVPDMPPEEAGELAGLCKEHSLALVLFLAPTSDESRIRLVTSKASGFIYLVSVTGVTGARADLPPGLGDFVSRVRAHSGDTPLVLGFGISTAAQISQLDTLVDGFIVGSAMVKAAADGVEGVRAFAGSLR